MLLYIYVFLLKYSLSLSVVPAALYSCVTDYAKYYIKNTPLDGAIYITILTQVLLNLPSLIKNVQRSFALTCEYSGNYRTSLLFTLPHCYLPPTDV